MNELKGVNKKVNKEKLDVKENNITVHADNGPR